MNFEINYMHNHDFAENDSNINYTSPSSDLKDYNSPQKLQMSSKSNSPEILQNQDKEENFQKVSF